MAGRLTTDWQVSSKSDPNANCVQVRLIAENDRGHTVEVRNSNHPDAGSTTYTAKEWDAFLGGAKEGEFQLPA